MAILRARNHVHKLHAAEGVSGRDKQAHLPQLLPCSDTLDVDDGDDDAGNDDGGDVDDGDDEPADGDNADGGAAPSGGKAPMRIL